MRSANPPPPSKVLMQSIQALTFNRGEMTTARRGEPIRAFRIRSMTLERRRADRRWLSSAHDFCDSTAPRSTAQLQCSGKPCKRYQPESVACWNIGNDGAGGVQWKVSGVQ